MITLQAITNGVEFTFTDSKYYLYGNGTISVPVNSLSLVLDNSGAATFRKAASNDIFVSAPLAEFGMTAEEIESFYTSNMVGSTGGGGGDVTSAQVQTMIDQSISGKADTSAVTEEIAAATSGKAENSALTAHTADTTIHFTTGTVESLITAATATLQPLLTAGTGIDITNNVISTTGQAGTAAVEVTQAEYDALVSGGTVDPTVFYVITDAPEVNLSGYAETSAVTAEIAAAVSGKADTSTVTNINNTLTAHTADTTVHVTSSDKSTWSGKQDALVSGTNIKTINNESILGSGNITIQGGGGTVSSAITSGDTNAVAGGAVYNKFDEVEQVTAAALINLNDKLNDKVETSAITSAVTSASTDSQIPTAKAVYDAIPTGSTGGGATYSAGTNISIDTGNTISCTLNLVNGSATGQGSILIAPYGTTATGNRSLAGGMLASAAGEESIAYGNHAKTNIVAGSSFALGSHVTTKNKYETSLGYYNNSVTASTTFGNSGNTLFSVGNGTADNARHNAFEVRQNGDIYCNNGTSDVKLQDYLQIKVMAISQADYDALVQAGTVDANTLYVITNVVS